MSTRSPGRASKELLDSTSKRWDIESIGKIINGKVLQPILELTSTQRTIPTISRYGMFRLRVELFGLLERF